MSDVPEVKQDNPFMVLCSHCGAFICTKCLEIENKQANLCGCDDCYTYSHRLDKRMADHLAKYDHALAEAQP